MTEPVLLTENDIYERMVATILDHRLPPGTKLVEDKDTADKGKQFVFAFEEGPKLTMKRKLQRTANSLSGEDSWTSDQGVVGFIRFDAGIPWSALGGVTISTDFGEIHANELTGVSQVTSFLRQPAVQQFTLKNAAGNSFTMTFLQPCQFDVFSYPPQSGMEGRIGIRAFWMRQNHLIEDGEFGWKIEMNPSEKK